MAYRTPTTPPPEEPLRRRSLARTILWRAIRMIAGPLRRPRCVECRREVLAKPTRESFDPRLVTCAKCNGTPEIEDDFLFYVQQAALRR